MIGMNFILILNFFSSFLGLLVNSIHPTKNQQEEAPEQEINASNQYKTVIRNLDEELLKSKHYQEFLEKENTIFNVNYIIIKS